MPTFPIPAIADVLFGNQQKDRLQGLEIWTDDSLANREIVRVQVAPQNINFGQRSRISEQVIKDGRAFFFWRKDRRSNHLDLMELQISGYTRSLAKEKLRTGGITGIRQVLSQEATDIGRLVTPGTSAPAVEDEPTPKQREWLRFWGLTRQPYTAEDHINRHHIRLNTPALPGQGPLGLEFIGHFTAPIQFAETADNPFLVQWQLSLVVHQTKPDLETFFQIANSFNVVP